MRTEFINVRDQTSFLGLGEGNVAPDVVSRATSQQIRRPLAQHSIELVDQQGNGGRSGICGDGRGEIGTGHFNETLGREVSIATAQIALHLDAEAKDARLMSEQAICLGFDRRLLGLTEFDVVRTQQQLRSGI